ncbi:MAG: 3-ketoacyl-ACP reductase [Bacteroidales bacterium]|nr:3-ketoacyl-ACP reductase [Bacteroidales bacterium]MDD3736880.1 3-ketoacyl-ACP reductase [Bacteroidales bacterium]
MNSKPVAIITGASRGIGRAVSLSLASEGFDIAAISRTPDSECMLSLQPETEERGAQFFPVGLDVAHTDLHDEAISNILERYGRIDLLVNNAGIAPIERRDLLDMDEESFDRVMGVNLRGPVFLARRVAKEMIWLKKKVPGCRPAIMFVTSFLSYTSFTHGLDVCVSKAGLSMAALVFADRLSEEGINVYEIRPGLIKTEMATRSKYKFERLITEGLVPQKRWGTPEDVAKAVASLARGDWSFSSGTIFEVSGGMNIRSI